MSNLAIVAPLPAIYPVPGIYPLHARTRAWCRSSFFKAYKSLHRLRSLPLLTLVASSALPGHVPAAELPVPVALSDRPPVPALA